MVAEGERAAGVFFSAFNEIAPELARLFDGYRRILFEAGVPAVLARNHRARNPVHTAEVRELHEPVLPVGRAAHAPYHHVLRAADRPFQKEVDGQRMGELSDVGETDGGSIRTALGCDPPDQREFGVGGGQEDDVAGRQSQIDGGVAVVDAGHVADEEMHRLAG